eukprot:2400966-Pyramimonas_sp.AAC.1
MPISSRSFERRRVAQHDRQGRKDPCKVDRSKTLLSGLPPVPFCVDPTSHCFLRQEGIRWAAEQ